MDGIMGSVARLVNTYDDLGNLVEQVYFDKNNNPAMVNGYYSSRKLEYDEF